MTTDNVIEVSGRFYVGRWVERAAQFQGPVKNPQGGIRSWFCRSLEQIPRMGGYSYARRTDAERRALAVYGEVSA